MSSSTIPPRLCRFQRVAAIFQRSLCAELRPRRHASKVDASIPPRCTVSRLHLCFSGRGARANRACRDGRCARGFRPAARGCRFRFADGGRVQSKDTNAYELVWSQAPHRVDVHMLNSPHDNMLECGSTFILRHLSFAGGHRMFLRHNRLS